MVSANFRIINNSDEKSDIFFFQKCSYLFALPFIIGEHTQKSNDDNNYLSQPKVKRNIFLDN